MRKYPRRSGFPENPPTDDISGIKEQIEKKRLWFKETYPEFYKLEVSADRPYFLDGEDT